MLASSNAGEDAANQYSAEMAALGKPSSVIVNNYLQQNVPGTPVNHQHLPQFTPLASELLGGMAHDGAGTSAS